MNRVLLGSGLAGVLALSGATVAQDKTPADAAKLLTPAAALNLRSISDLQFSPDGARVAFVLTEPPKAERRARHIWVYDKKAGAVRQFTFSPKDESSPRWSADGKQLAFLSNRDEQQQIYIMRADGGEAAALTKGKRSVRSFAWSPDGKQIAYTAVFSNENYSAIYRKASDGSGQEELLYKHTPGSAVFITDWSVDGRLCFWSGDVIYALPVDGDRKPVVLFSGFGARGGRFSPDGRYLAYSSNPSGRFETYVAPLDNPAQKPLQMSKDGALGGIFWRQDSKELYFMALVGLAPNGVMVVDLTVGPELQAGTPRLLFRPAVNSPAQLSNIATRDAERFVFLTQPPAPAR